MKHEIKVKPAYKNTKVGFNNSGAPLGQRDDLALLLINAYKGNDKFILNMFDEPPTLDQLQKGLTDEKIAAITNPVQPVNEKPAPTSEIITGTEEDNSKKK